MPLRYVYTMVIAINANFHLQCYAISSNARDSPLKLGWRFFVNGKPYKEDLLIHVKEKEVQCDSIYIVKCTTNVKNRSPLAWDCKLCFKPIDALAKILQQLALAW